MGKWDQNKTMKQQMSVGIYVKEWMDKA